MLLQIPALVRAGCTALPVQRHTFQVAEHMDWVLRLQAELKTGEHADGTGDQHDAVVARLQCKAVQELLDSRQGQVLMMRVHLK